MNARVCSYVCYQRAVNSRAWAVYPLLTAKLALCLSLSHKLYWLDIALKLNDTSASAPATIANPASVDRNLDESIRQYACYIFFCTCQ